MSRLTTKVLTAMLVAVAGALMAAAPAGAIVGGTPDGDAHPAVGLLAFDVDGTGDTPPFALCGGTVISDRAFLTARHCIEPPLIQLPPGVEWVVTLEPGSPASPIAPGGVFPDTYPACCALTVPESKLARATDVVLDEDFEPGFVPGRGEPEKGRHDLAVVLFAPGTFAGVEPVRLARPGALDHLRASARKGPQLTLAGYGVERRAGTFFYPGYRKTARATFHDLDGNWLQLESAVGVLPRSGALCFGDSGSPQFLGGTDIQVALHHDAPGDCSGIAYTQRLDTPAEREFLAPFH